MDRENRVEEMRKADSMRLGDEPEEVAGAVETPRPTGLDEIEASFVVTVEDLVCDLSRRRLVGQLDGLRPKPLNVHDGDRAVW